MKVLLRREQRPGMLGGSPVFSLIVRAQISDEEAENIRKYKLGATELYTSRFFRPEVDTMKGFAKDLLAQAKATTLTVNDLWQGKKIDCKDILEMLAIEEQIRNAASMFKAVLESAARFGGEEVLEL